MQIIGGVYGFPEFWLTTENASFCHLYLQIDAIVFKNIEMFNKEL